MQKKKERKILHFMQQTYFFYKPGQLKKCVFFIYEVVKKSILYYSRRIQTIYFKRF